MPEVLSVCTVQFKAGDGDQGDRAFPRIGGDRVGHWSPQMMVKSKGNPTQHVFFLGGMLHKFTCFFSNGGELHLFLGGNL